MPTKGNRLGENWWEGNTPSIRRTIDRSESGMASGVTVSRAWLTVKTNQSDADGSAIVQKEVTTTNVAGTGQVENDGGGDVDPIVRYDLGVADTRAIGTRSRYYDMKVLLSSGGVHTFEDGVIAVRSEITVDDS